MYQSFQSLNELLARLDHPQARESLQKLLSVSSTAVSLAKALPDTYAREYALVQRLKYDDQGNVSDVTPKEQLTVAQNTIDSVIESLKALIAQRDSIKDPFTGINFTVPNPTLTALSVDDGRYEGSVFVRNLNTSQVEVKTESASDANWRGVHLLDLEHPAYAANIGQTITVRWGPYITDPICILIPILQQTPGNHYFTWARYRYDTNTISLKQAVDPSQWIWIGDIAEPGVEEMSPNQFFTYITNTSDYSKVGLTLWCGDEQWAIQTPAHPPCDAEHLLKGVIRGTWFTATLGSGTPSGGLWDKLVEVVDNTDKVLEVIQGL